METTFIDDYREDIFSTYPEIGQVRINPEFLAAFSNATFGVDVSSDFAVSEVILSYSTDGGQTWNNVSMKLIDGTWTVTLIRVQAGSIIYKIYAMDCLGNWNEGEQLEVSVSPIDIVTLLIIGGVAIVGIIGAVTIFRKRT